MLLNLSFAICVLFALNRIRVLLPPFDQNFLMWGAVPGSTTMVSVHKGQLVVDLIDASQKKLVWRGMASEKLSDKKQKLMEQVDTAVGKMFRQYPAAKK